MLSRIERAKQFLPFDAVKGLQFALREKENLCMSMIINSIKKYKER